MGMVTKWIEPIRFHPGIKINEIPVSGFAGVLFASATMLMVLTPVARDFLLITGSAGMIWAGVLYWWHNQTRW